MQSPSAKPIFIVGSPRSGTSVLAWCLGQHPNIFPVPESNWMGDFAVDVAKSYQIGAARGKFSILSAMDITPSAFFATFGQSIDHLILAHRGLLEQKRGLDITSTWKNPASGPKTRWVDGTPEYSLHMCGLRKLFPAARFIHLVRNVDAVVRSLLNFHRVSGIHLVPNEEEAYKHWLRRVNACLEAERAYGPEVVHRLLYSNLVKSPELTIQSVLNFVGEPYSAACLEPLRERINSSNVSADFKSDDPATDRAIVEEARRLSAEMEQTAQSSAGSLAAAEELEGAFQNLCSRAASIEKELVRQQQHYTALIAKQEQRYECRLGKQLGEIQQLLAMLDEVATIAGSFQASRFWTFANKLAAIEVKFSHNKDFVSNSSFRKLLAKYSRWRASHPHFANRHEPIQHPESSVRASSSDS